VAAKESSAAARTIELSRLIDAPRTRVFEAWTTPEHLASWWGPMGFDTSTSVFEFRVGGIWRFVMHGPDGRDYDNEIAFDAIAPNERIAYRHSGENPEPVRFVTVASFAEEAGKTRVTLTMEFESVEECARVKRDVGAEEGGRQTLARLAAHTSQGSAYDLVIRRELDAPVELVWRCWTEADLLALWWAPDPVRTEVHALDPWPGGALAFSMTLPDGRVERGDGVFLEVAPNRRIAFTDALQAGWRPSTSPFITAVATMAEHDGRTRYVVRVFHRSAEDRDRHEAMGFFEGWNTCITQMEQLARSLRT